MSTPPAALLPEETRQLQRLLPGVFAGDPTALRSAHRMLGGAIARVDDPASIKAVPHSQWPPRGFTRGELASRYCGWNDRFVVALIVGYASTEVIDARDACVSALDLVQGSGRDGTRWFVYDRHTQEMFTFAQGELEHDEPLEPSEPAAGQSAIVTLDLIARDEVPQDISLEQLLAAARKGEIGIRVVAATTAPIGPETLAARIDANVGVAVCSRPLLSGSVQAVAR